MAPDLNTVPASPRNPASVGPTNTASTTSPSNVSRSESQIQMMSPPPLPPASPSGAVHTPTVQQPFTQPFPPLTPVTSTQGSGGDNSNVPIRHPRPLTAAELHLELEKEQEAVVSPGLILAYLEDQLFSIASSPLSRQS